MTRDHEIIGRVDERSVLDQALKSSNAELIAVYGRRRVGKTFLVREHYRDCLRFEASGLHNEPLSRQLANFGMQIRHWFPDIPLVTFPTSWLEAFDLLRSILEKQPRQKQKLVLFLDEFPWFATPKSGFLAAFENFWNVFASRRDDIVVVLCGSAAAWMIRQVIQSRGGLHNRVTRRIQLYPFQLHETNAYLKWRHVHLEPMQIALLYMALGGVPHYLNLVEPGRSAAQILEQVCLRESAPMQGEYEQLYGALFTNHTLHEAIMMALVHSRSGLVRNELLQKAKLESGGSVSQALNELIASGFVSEQLPFDRKERDRIYRIADEFSYFYWNWMAKKRFDQTWASLASSRRFMPWCGYAFESLCLKHIRPIKRKLGIEAVETRTFAWRYQPQSKDEQGAQINLALQRADYCTHLCEMKFSFEPFVITKAYSKELLQKEAVYRARTGTRNTLFLTMVTASGLAKNSYSQTLIPCQVELVDLMQ
jgi:hypothetical protein